MDDKDPVLFKAHHRYTHGHTDWRSNYGAPSLKRAAPLQPWLLIAGCVAALVVLAIVKVMVFH